MITLILLSYFTQTLSAVPVATNVHPPSLPQGGVQHVQPAEATNVNMESQTPAPLLPGLRQTRPEVPHQMGPEVGPQQMVPQVGTQQMVPQVGTQQMVPNIGTQQMVPQFGPQNLGPQVGVQAFPPMQPYPWSALGMIIPLQPGMYGPQAANQPSPQQHPLIFPSYGYFPMFSPYANSHQPPSPYGFPNIPQAPLQQSPASQPLQTPNSQTLAAASPSGVPPTGDAPPLQQQQQNPQIVYMLQQPMTSPLGALSSEELEMAAKMNQLSAYLPTMIRNLPSGGVQTLNHGTRFRQLEQLGELPAVGTSGAGRPQGPSSTGPQPDMRSIPNDRGNLMKSPVQPQLQEMGAISAQD